jgi:hypothetical protein
VVDDLLIRFWTNVTHRVHGPFTFRLLLQPAMAAFFAFRDGLSDARRGRPAFGWALFTHTGARSELVSEGFRSIGRVFILGVVMDVLYQLIVFRWLFVGEIAFVVIMLVVVPYLVVRGLVNLAVRFRLSRRPPPG